MLIDTHTHICDPKLAQDVENVLQSAKAADVAYMLDIGCDMNSAKVAVENSKKYENVFAVVGVHPHDAQRVPRGYLDILSEYLRLEKTVALGEIGLDFYRDLSPRDAQMKVFKEQLELAKSLQMPIVIHS